MFGFAAEFFCALLKTRQAELSVWPGMPGKQPGVPRRSAGEAFRPNLTARQHTAFEAGSRPARA
jgi:hypothetical protein